MRQHDSKTIAKVPIKEFDVCARCATALTQNYQAGTVRKRADGIDENGGRSSVRRSVLKYFCSTRCLEDAGATPESTFAFGDED